MKVEHVGKYVKYMCIGGENDDLILEDITVVHSAGKYIYPGTEVTQGELKVRSKNGLSK